MFSNTGRFYDAVYSFKNYATEAERVRDIVDMYAQRPAESLLDVACGTGSHLFQLRPYYSHVEGLDLDPELLSVARERLPAVTFTQGDMSSFDLGRRFDVVTCLFSSIGYTKTQDKLNAAVACMAQHLEPEGVLIVEPWLTPDQFEPGYLSVLLVDEQDFKVARMSLSTIENNLWVLNFHYMIGNSQGIEYTTERHELGLFTHEDYRAAFAAAGLHTSHDLEGLTGRGLYVGVKA